MPRTAWSSNSGSVPSDFIRPSRPTPSPQPKGKVTKASKTQGPPRSKSVRKLDTYLEHLRSASGKDKDPMGGCFCQAREHQLSMTSPICFGCGMVMCEVNQPYYACPHCAHVVLTPTLRAALIADAEERIAKTLADEDRAREREVQEARMAAGAFPALGGGPPPPPGVTMSYGNGGLRPPLPPQQQQQQQQHKVLSLNSKTKKHTLSTYSATPSPSPSRPASRAESVEEEPHRVPPPLSSWEAGGGARGSADPARPFKNPDFPNLRYIPLHSVEEARPSRRNKGKGGNKRGDASAQAGSSSGGQAN